MPSAPSASCSSAAIASLEWRASLPLQDAGVARLDAEGEDVGRDIGAGFADHADHAERYRGA
ncbi:MAG: hypothetical protein ACLUQ6_06625 [Alistipes onderdonkii]